MSERDRIRRLHVENRLEELRAKYGRALEDEPMPDWLDSLEGWQAAQERAQPTKAPEPTTEPSATTHALRPADVRSSMLDRYQETPLFLCPRCGAESAKASFAIDLWNCTACQSCGRATVLFGWLSRRGGAQEVERPWQRDDEW